MNFTVKYSHSPYRSSSKALELTVTESQSRYVQHYGGVQDLQQRSLLLITKTFYVLTAYLTMLSLVQVT